MATQLDRIERLLAALCDHLGIHDVNTSRPQSAKDVGAEHGRRYVGVVSRFEHGWGFIECAELDHNFFVHYSDIEGTGLRSLKAGEQVTFEVGPGKDGRPKAVRVRRPSTGPAAPGEAASSRDTAGEDSRAPGVEDARDEDTDMPQPESSGVLPPRSSPRRTTARRVRLGALPGRRPAISW